MIGAAYATREFGAPLAEYMAAYVPKYTGAYSIRNWSRPWPQLR